MHYRRSCLAPGSLLVVLLGLALALMWSPVPGVQAAGPVTYTVSNTADGGSGSLRDAVTQSNANDPGSGGHNTITFAAGAMGTITLTNGTLTLMQDVTITGPGARTLAVDGGCTDCGSTSANTSGTGHTILVVSPGVTASVSNLTFQNGRGTAPGNGGNTGFNNVGGAIAVSGIGTASALTVTDCAFTGNSAQHGGAIAVNSLSTLQVTGAAFQDNYASQSGGAITNGYSLIDAMGVGSESDAGDVTITNSTFFGNEAQFGGAIYTSFQGVTSLQSVTVSGSLTTNTRRIYPSGAVANGTFSNPTTVLANSLLAGNRGRDGDYSNATFGASATTTDNGHNLIGTATGYTFTSPTDKVGVPPLVGSLGLYGSTRGTMTLPLLPESPAINAGGSGCSTTDQRGVARVGVCDIGAFESRGFTLALTTTAGSSTPIGRLFAPLTLSVTSNVGGEQTARGEVTLTVTTGATWSGLCVLSNGNHTAVCPINSDGTVSMPTLTAGSSTGDVIFTAHTVAASDRGLTLHVVNPVPTLTSLAPAGVPTGQAFTLSVVGTNFLSGVTTVQIGPVSFTAAQVTVADAAHLSVSVSATALTVTGIMTVTVTNPAPVGGSATAPFTVTNTAPTLTQPANLTLREDAGPQSVTVTGIGAGAGDTGQTLTVIVTSDTPGVIPDSAITLIYTSPNATATLAYTVVANANTPTTPVTLTVTVHDNGGTANGGQDTTARAFTVTVTPVNDAPVFTTGADVSVIANTGAYAYPFATAISAGPPDESGQTLAFIVTGNTRAALFAVPPALSPTGVLTFTPATDAVGSATITLLLTDSGGTANGGNDTSAPQSFTLTVTAAAVTALTATAPTGSGSGNSGAADAPTLRAGTTLTLTTVGSYNNRTRGPVSSLTYTGYDPNVLRIDANGAVTALSAGTTIVTITAPNGITTALTITVTAGSGGGLTAPAPQPVAKPNSAPTTPGASVAPQPTRKADAASPTSGAGVQPAVTAASATPIVQPGRR